MLAALEQLSVQLEATHGVAPADAGRHRHRRDGRHRAWPSASAGEFLVVGETANRAARLQAAARPGTVLLSADTTRQVRGRVRAAPGARAGAQGHRRPGRRLRRRRRRARGLLAGDPRRRGRRHPHDRPRAAAAPAAGRVRRRRQRAGPADRHRRSGEAGVGKSRLVHDVDTWLARLPTEVWVLRGRASPSTENVPNALLRSVFAERLGIRATDAPDRVRRKWREGWAQLLGTDEPHGRRARDGRRLARVRGRRGGPRAPSAPPTPSRCGGGGARWSCGCSTGSPSGRRSSCCWRTCTGPTRRAWTRWRRSPRRPAAARCWCSPPPGRRCSSSGRPGAGPGRCTRG